MDWFMDSFTECIVFGRFQDFLQVLSMFSGFQFKWPPAIIAIYNALSLVNFNFELLAPECSVSLNFETKWYIVQSLPLILIGGICVVLSATWIIQQVQVRVLHTLPFGALRQVSLTDVCVGIAISGTFMLYFGESDVVAQQSRARVVSGRSRSCGPRPMSSCCWCLLSFFLSFFLSSRDQIDASAV